MSSILRVLLVCGVLFPALPSPSLAWNKAGHMVSGAIAYRELAESDARALSRVILLLEQHPEYETRWAPQLGQSFIPAQERDFYLFMLAARWPDDIRGDAEFDEPSWHFVNLPFKPLGEGAGVATSEPDNVNMLSAFRDNLAVVRDGKIESKRAEALCWVFHLVGNVHQPLHVTNLFTTRFPEGDRGGTRFFIRARGGARTITLHKLWDDFVLGTQRFREVRNTATELRARPPHQRGAMSELAEPEFEKWARLESLPLAKEHVYRGGAFRGSTDPGAGAVLPEGYLAEAKSLSERRVTLAGYRLADLLSELF